MSTERILAARNEVGMARMRIASTIDRLQERLKPANLANEAWAEVKEKGGAIADEALQAVRGQPVAAGGAAAAVAMFLARKPLGKWLGAAADKLRRDDDDDTEAKPSPAKSKSTKSKAAKPPSPRRPKPNKEQQNGERVRTQAKRKPAGKGQGQRGNRTGEGKRDAG